MPWLRYVHARRVGIVGGDHAAFADGNGLPYRMQRFARVRSASPTQPQVCRRRRRRRSRVRGRRPRIRQPRRPSLSAKVGHRRDPAGEHRRYRANPSARAAGMLQRLLALRGVGIDVGELHVGADVKGGVGGRKERSRRHHQPLSPACRSTRRRQGAVPRCCCRRPHARRQPFRQRPARRRRPSARWSGVGRASLTSSASMSCPP